MLLHFKKFQILLIFWLALFGAVSGNFMASFGVDSLYLSPEYLGSVNAISAGIVGMSVGIFIMSWNITTFILFCRHFRFLATTTRPFLKYCINNAVIPLLFLVFYFVNAVDFDLHKELLSVSEVMTLVGGFLVGLVLIIFLSLGYFFGADITIARNMISLDPSPMALHRGVKPHIVLNSGGSRLIKVTTYLSGRLNVKAVRDVTHYSKEFLESIFSRHHFAAVLSIFIAFVFLMLVGFLLDYDMFKLPAAASITIFFAILVSVAGAFSYFLQSWSVPFAVVLIIVLNLLYRYGVIDPTNKAYGLNYGKEIRKAAYTPDNLATLSSAERVRTDSLRMVQVLENWKRRQGVEKPHLYIINVSGGGTRSATFTMGVMQKLDSICGGQLMRKTFMITGASGGMLGAAYFRALSRERDLGKPVRLQDSIYVDDISKDLLNPTFSSFVARVLALTKLLTEILTIILAVLVIHRLPKFRSLSTIPTRIRDGAIAISFGLSMMLLVLVVQNADRSEHVVRYYANNAVEKAYGSNVVNTILVDFRAMDTLGEIVVLAVAALGVYALMHLRIRREEE